MYDESEGSSSIYYGVKGLIAIASIIAVIYLGSRFITKLKERKLQFTLIDLLKFFWMIVSVAILIYLFSLFLPEFSFDAGNKKFMELMPIKKGVAGAFVSIGCVFAILIFCIGGIDTYFKKTDDTKENKP